MSAVTDPECVGLDSVPHLVADHCSRPAPSVVLAAATTFHLVLRSLRLPVVDLRPGEVDLMSAKIWPGGDRTVVSLAVVQIDDGLHRFLSDLQSSLIAGI